MGTNFKHITTILMIICIATLAFILIKYFNTPVSQSNRYNEIVNNNFSTNSDVNHIIDEVVSGDIITSDNFSGEVYSGESGEISGEDIKRPDDLVPNKKSDSPVIISSESTMTNKEKREILTELDSTLKELLDVVDKVQTVDETRLTTDESEVQE